jgi:hypothetical protein
MGLSTSISTPTHSSFDGLLHFTACLANCNAHFTALLHFLCHMRISRPLTRDMSQECLGAYLLPSSSILKSDKHITTQPPTSGRTLPTSELRHCNVVPGNTAYHVRTRRLGALFRVYGASAPYLEDSEHRSSGTPPHGLSLQIEQTLTSCLSRGPGPSVCLTSHRSCSCVFALLR